MENERKTDQRERKKKIDERALKKDLQGAVKKGLYYEIEILKENYVSIKYLYLQTQKINSGNLLIWR